MEGNPFIIEIKRDTEKQILRFSGQLIINHISKITEEIKKTLNIESDIEIIIDNPDNIDVTFIQLIYSIKRDYISENKKVTITGDLKDELKTLVANSGFHLLQN